MNQHIGDFWDTQSTGYQYTAKTPRIAGRKRIDPVKKRALIRNAVLITVGILVVTAVVLRFAVFSIRTITVVGNRDMSAGEIIALSGIRKGDNILTLNERQVEEKITSNWRLIFRYVEKELPNAVTLSVREREACCWLNYCGIMYAMDKNRMVLFETEDVTMRPALPEVKGLDIRSGCMTGQTMILTSQEQQQVFSEMFLEMKVLGCTPAILEVDLNNLNSILVVTRDGFTVSMGDRQNLHAKLRSMLLVQEQLKAMGESGGSISVVNPENPYYSPPK